ncbi:GAF and ANTAR domain-containing protein [Modestobacter versicolor]|uniref:Antitermination regulator n=1 Tax=Modestobacter versicolor TaxID=429133 RepID=A0A323VET2_9ACTN|nr:GAF and ANTAR domain-containing protein [Modestobacter versicolor]MBB3674686.1 GAF domain-containing protein [Modestobacter versicolor]PZA23247.1 antitermination regulator [Modestobacter versicolor]
MSSIDRNSAVDEATAFELLGGIALSEHSLHSVFQAVADLTKQVMPGDIEASVSLLVADKATTVVYTGQLALDLDESQYGRGYGPCLHAASTGQAVEVEDARTEVRWPDYMKSAVERGGLSSLSIPLGSPTTSGAGLNIYAREAAAFDDDSRRIGHRFARFAGVAVANLNAYQSAREQADNLQVALESRAVIDQAKGILIERYKLTADEAFKLLAQASMASNQKLRLVADHLVTTGELIMPPSRS